MVFDLNMRTFAAISLLGLLFGLLVNHQAMAVTDEFYAREDVSAWIVQPTLLECVLKHPVPEYGEGVFIHEAGEALRFQLNALRPLPRADQVIVESKAPPWAANNELKHLGVTEGVEGGHPVKVNEHLSASLLAELKRGYLPLLTHEGWVMGDPLRVVLSSVNFGPAYEQFSACVSELFPANFRQLERTTVLFDTDKSDIKSDFMDRLELLVDYMNIDASVNRLYIDGHTDNVGGNGYNWDLSKRRAEAVQLYLKGLGLEEDQIIMRYHGELLPITDNGSSVNRARNRRVTLRLEQDS